MGGHFRRKACMWPASGLCQATAACVAIATRMRALPFLPSGLVRLDEPGVGCNPCGVRSMNEIPPLERAAEAYDRMMIGEAHFRVVLTAA